MEFYRFLLILKYISPPEAENNDIGRFKVDDTSFQYFPRLTV